MHAQPILAGTGANEYCKASSYSIEYSIHEENRDIPFYQLDHEQESLFTHFEILHFNDETWCIPQGQDGYDFSEFIWSMILCTRVSQTCTNPSSTSGSMGAQSAGGEIFILGASVQSQHVTQVPYQSVCCLWGHFQFRNEVESRPGKEWSHQQCATYDVVMCLLNDYRD